MGTRQISPTSWRFALGYFISAAAGFHFCPQFDMIMFTLFKAFEALSHVKWMASVQENLPFIYHTIAYCISFEAWLV